MSLLSLAISNSFKAFVNSDAFLLFLKGKDKVIEKNGVEFHLHFFNPNVNNTSTNPPRITTRDHLMPPYEPFIELDHCRDNGARHFLILNRYQFCPGHMIMATDDTSEFQGSPLLKHDYAMLSHVLNQVDPRGVAYYNGGVDAGCTQFHKHMQYVPNFYNPLFDRMAQGQRLPYRYYTHKLDDYSPDQIGYAYNKLMERMDHSGSYNLVISNKVAIIVPRAKARHSSDVLLNSMGICGHLSVWNFNYKQVEKDPMDVYRECCLRID